MVDIVDEIISEDKDAKRIYYFQKLFIPIIIATIIIACGIAVYSYYSFKAEEHNREIGDLLVDVMGDTSADEESIITALEGIVQNSDNDTRQLAKLKRATEYIDNGRAEKASQILQGIIDDTSFFEITRAYARLLMMTIILDSSEIDDAIQLKASNLLNYFSDTSHPFFATATLIKANFYMKIGQRELAEKYAQEVIDLKSSHAVIKEQASALIAMLKYL